MPPTASILEVARVLEGTSTRIVLAVEEETKLLGIVTDGDIRRGLLAGVSVEEPCEKVVNACPQTIAPDGRMDDAILLADMSDADAIPIVADGGRLVGVWVSRPGQEQVPNTVVIMAGGKGMRLRPMTTAIPKPLVSLRDKPMLHRLLERLHSQGFENVSISINYLGEQIEDSVGDGSSWGLTVTYLREDSPLGTAGALGLLEDIPENPVLVINADVVTSARFRTLLDQHSREGAAITMGMRVHDIEHPFGVLDLEGSRVSGMREKPIWREFVSAGVYVLSPEVLSLIPLGRSLDMPDLVSLTISEGLPVQGFPLHESWLDVGTPDDFRTAQGLIDEDQQ